MTLVAQDLTKEVGGRVLYRGLDLRVEEGSTLVIHGASGVGKSQLLRQLSGLDPAVDTGLRQSGTVTYRGRGISEWGAYDWRSQICCVPQQVPNLDGTPADFEQRISALRAQHSRQTDDPRALADEFEFGAELWEKPWAQLSVGEGQRALLAVLIARRPGVLLLDEPTAALDWSSAQSVERRLQNETCVWVTHSADQAERVADDTLTLSGSVHVD